MELPSTVSRVADHTPDWVNMAIQQNTDEAITYYRHHPEKIIQRLNELDREWDIERMLEANAASFDFSSSGCPHEQRDTAGKSCPGRAGQRTVGIAGFSLDNGFPVIQR